MEEQYNKEKREFEKQIKDNEIKIIPSTEALCCDVNNRSFDVRDFENENLNTKNCL